MEGTSDEGAVTFLRNICYARKREDTMAINGVTTGVNTGNIASASVSYESHKMTAEITQTTVTATTGEAAVFEKSADAAQKQEKLPKEHKVDTETIEKLKADADARYAQLRGIVEKLLLKQSGTVSNSEGLASMYKKLEVDPETQKQAQEDISEDGYWGVEQTSDRILDFAKALAGEDPEIAKSMLEAIKEGFKQAEDAWGEELPGLSKDTMEATLKKVNDWLKELGVETDEQGEEAQSPATAAAATRTTVTATTTTIKYSESSSKFSASVTMKDDEQ